MKATAVYSASRQPVSAYGELSILAKIAELGHRVERYGARHPFDIIVDGKVKVEAMISCFSKEISAIAKTLLSYASSL